jgi:hypothetical protein
LPLRAEMTMTGDRKRAFHSPGKLPSFAPVGRGGLAEG